MISTLLAPSGLRGDTGAYQAFQEPNRRRNPDLSVTAGCPALAVRWIGKPMPPGTALRLLRHKGCSHLAAVARGDHLSPLDPYLGVGRWEIRDRRQETAEGLRVNFSKGQPSYYGARKPKIKIGQFLTCSNLVEGCSSNSPPQIAKLSFGFPKRLSLSDIFS